MEWDADDYDSDSVSGDEPTAYAMNSSANPSHILTADQVAAVRFYTTRPGYSFEQVEIFVDQVKESLTALENTIYQKELALHEAKEDQGELQDRIATLAATIEVFRAKGDPVVRSDGTYLTESQRISESDVEHLRAANEEASARLEAAAQENLQLRQSIEALQAALKEQEGRAAEAEEAEAELREYIDNALAQWIAEQMANQATRAATAAEDLHTPPANSYAEPNYETDYEASDPLPQEQEYGGESETPFSPGWSQQGDADWGDDAPSVRRDMTPEEQVAALPHLPPPTTPPRSRAKLIDAPELSSQ